MSHPFFETVSIEELNTENFDRRLAESSEDLVGVFFWGHDCPNCEVAKNALFREAEAMNYVGLKWFHVNTYKDFSLATQFGLFGIPTFLFFAKGKKLGRISPFPGTEAFFEANRSGRHVENLIPYRLFFVRIMLGKDSSISLRELSQCDLLTQRAHLPFQIYLTDWRIKH